MSEPFKLPAGGFNLPPGVSSRDIEEHFGDEEEQSQKEKAQIEYEENKADKESD